MRQPAETLPSRDGLALKILDACLQASTVLALAVAIFALQARFACHLYLLAAPVVPMALWVCSGLVIDRQALRGPRR